MKEILAKLFESQVLNDETKAELEQAITEAISTAVTEAREQAIVEAQAEVAKQWETERNALVEALDAKVSAAIEPEVAQLRETVEQFNTMKVELGKRYIAQRKQLAENVKNELGQLVEDLDTFMTDVVAKEMGAAKEQLRKIHEDNFGRRIYKAFVREFAEKHADMGAIEGQRTELQSKLQEAIAENAALRGRLADIERKAKLKELLSPLQGETRKVMEAVLATVPTEKLDESCKMFLARVLKPSEKEKTEVLAETGKPAGKPQAPKGNIVTGDATPLPARKTPDQIAEGVDDEFDKHLRHLQRVAGINSK